MQRRLVPGNAKLLKELNEFQTLDALRRNGAMARSQLARLTGLTAPTVGVIVGSLLEQGLLLERESQPGAVVGRRAVPLEINPRAGTAIGINLGVTHALMLAVDLNGQVQARARFDVRAEMSPQEMIDRLGAGIGGLGADVTPMRRVGGGAGLHGLVNHDAGVLRFAPHFGWRDVPFTALLSRALGWPVVADNGVRCMALGELWFGAGRGVNNFVCVAVGTGIGSAIVLDGRLYRGVHGTAGEIGHVTIDVEGPQCHCGSYGCLETLASGPAIARRAVRLIKQGMPSAITAMVVALEDVTAETVARAAASGDAVAVRILQEAGTHLGIAVANLAKTLNPEMVLIGGGVSQAGERLLEPLRQGMVARALDEAARRLPVRRIALGGDAGALGAAALVLEKFFKGSTVPAVLEMIER